MMYLVDTDLVIDGLVGTPQARTLLTALRPHGLAMSIVTYVEVFEGIIGGRNRQRAENVFRAFLHRTAVLGITPAIAEQTAAIRVELRRRRHQITHRAMDLLIAATAIEHGLILVTRYTIDYADISNPRRYPLT